METKTAGEGYHLTVQSELGKLDEYTRWVIRVFDGYYGNRILDIGSSTGNIVAEITLTRKPEVITSIDISDAVLGELREMTTYPTFTAEKIDVQDEGVLRLSEQHFDTITCFNVLEHVKDDIKALKNMHSLLVEGGKLLLFVPAIPWIYGQVDECTGHHRRYEKKGLLDKLAQSGFTVEMIRNVNCFTILPWYAYGRLTSRGAYPRFRSPRILNFLVRCMAQAEELIPPPVGLSMACVCSKGGKSRPDEGSGGCV